MTREDLVEHCDFRWKEDEVDAMSAGEQVQFLLSEAGRFEAQEEWETAYGIYRELVWRFPIHEDLWRRFAEVAERVGKNGEAEVARGGSTVTPSAK